MGNPAALLEKFKSINKELRTKLRHFNYYRKNKTSLLGRIINLLMAEMVLFMIGYLWFVYKTKIPMLSLFLSLTINALLTIAYVLRDRKLYLKGKSEKRRQVARDFLVEHMRQLDPDEFKWHISRVLLKLEGIDTIEDKGNFLITSFKGKCLAIGCHNDRFGEGVSPRELAGFLNQAKSEGFPSAIFITTGRYSDSCMVLAEKTSTIKLHLLTEGDLLDIMERTDMFPDKKTVDALIEKKIDSQKFKLNSLGKEIMKPKRIPAYLGYSLLFSILSRIMYHLRIYYTAVSFTFLLLAALSWVQKHWRPAEPAENQQLIDELTAREG